MKTRNVSMAEQAIVRECNKVMADLLAGRMSLKEARKQNRKIGSMLAAEALLMRRGQLRQRVLEKMLRGVTRPERCHVDDRAGLV